MNNIYLDNAATTPLSSDVKDYIISILDIYGNPSSVHSVGNTANKIINTARKNVGKFIGLEEQDNLNSNVIFTSSGSAANTLAILGLRKIISKYKSFFYSPTAHKSMILASKTLDAQPIKIQADGKIDVQFLENMLSQSEKPVICFEAANSEIGIIQNLEEIIQLIHKYNGIAIVDFTGYIPYKKVNVKVLDVDIATFSGHKLHALKGVGVLYRKDSIELEPLVYGSQEHGLFGGTENLIGIASLGKACEIYNYENISTDKRDYLKDRILQTVPDCYVIGDCECRLPYNLYFCFKGVHGESLVMLLDMNKIQVSTGSACNENSIKPSDALVAIGIQDTDIHSCIRITLSGDETIEELDYVAETIRNGVYELRGLSNNNI